MIFNLNDYIRVRLTETGRRLHREKWEECHRHYPRIFPTYKPPKETDGWYSQQFWALMQDYGQDLRLGFDQPFDMNVDLVLPKTDFESTARALAAAVLAGELDAVRPLMDRLQEILA